MKKPVRRAWRYRVVFQNGGSSVHWITVIMWIRAFNAGRRKDLDELAMLTFAEAISLIREWNRIVKLTNGKYHYRLLLV